MPVCAVARRIVLFATLLIGIGMIGVAQATVFSVNNPVVNQIGNGHVLDADIRYPLTPRVIEALDNGVPITFVQELRLLRSLPILGRFWSWETTLWESSLRYELRYHALSEQYVLLALDTGVQQSFPTMQGALATLGRLRGLTLPPEHLQDRGNLVLRIRSKLDLNALPTPMRPGALLSDKWQLTSPWVEAVWR